MAPVCTRAGQLWPYLDSALSPQLREVLEPVFKERRARWMLDIGIDQCALKTIPLSQFSELPFNRSSGRHAALQRACCLVASDMPLEEAAAVQRACCLVAAVDPCLRHGWRAVASSRASFPDAVCMPC